MILSARAKEWRMVTQMQLMWVVEAHKLKPVQYPNGVAYVKDGRTIAQTVDGKHYVRR